VYSSPNIRRVIKERRMRWAGHIARLEDISKACKILLENLSGRNHLGELVLDVIIILKWTLKNSMNL
jgi:hypothetical protein